MPKRKPKAKPVTTEEFDRALEALVDEMTPSQILGIPGVYAVLSEALNNEAIDLALNEREETES